MTKALVTGGTGFIGSHVVRHLLKQQVEVRCLVRPESKRANLQGLKVEIVEGDLRNTASLYKAVAGCEMLFHVAADYRLWMQNPAEMEKTNVEGTRNLFHAALQAGVKKIIFTSSVAAIGRPKMADGLGVGKEELDPTPEQLVGPYKKNKFNADKFARETAQKGAPIVIVNPSTPIGSHDIKPTPTGKMIVDLLNGKMPGYVETGMNFVNVEDVAAGHWLAAQKGRVGERYILGGKNYTLKEFLFKVAKRAGVPPPRYRIPYALAYLVGAISTGWAIFSGKEPGIPLDGVRMAHETMYYDPRKAVHELELPQTAIEEGIGKAVDWFRANGYVK